MRILKNTILRFGVIQETSGERLEFIERLN